MKLATWNVNSIRQRESLVVAWLERVRPDILMLQEIKCEAAAFPAAAFDAIGYRSEVVGQKAYNGVAVLSRVPADTVLRALPGLPDGDAQARYVEVATGDMVVGGLYLPNGNSGGEAGYAYKLAWMEALRQRAETCLEADTPLALLGDFNVCPTDADFSAGVLGPDDALCRPPTRAAFRALEFLGLTDAIRALRPSARSGPSGTTRPVAGPATGVCASITPCCRPLWRSGDRRLA